MDPLIQLLGRVMKMFLGDGDRPRSSGDLLFTQKCTNGLIIDVRTVVSKLWRDSQDEIKRRCISWQKDGLIDKMDVLAMALNDALRGGALLHKDDTNLFGKRIAQRAKVVQSRIANEQKRAARHMKGASDRAEQDAAIEKRLRAEIYEPNLPESQRSSSQRLHAARLSLPSCERTSALSISTTPCPSMTTTMILSRWRMPRSTQRTRR